MTEDQHQTPDEIRARGVLEHDDLMAAQMLGGLSGVGRVVLWLIVLIGVAATVAHSTAFLVDEGLVADPQTAWVLATGGFAILSILAFGSMRLLAARRRGHRVSGAEVEYVIRSDGLEIRDSWSRARLPWSAFTGWNEVENSFCFYQPAGVCRVLPFRFLQPGDVDRLRTWLRQILGEPGVMDSGR